MLRDEVHPRRQLGVFANQSFQIAHGVAHALPRFLGFRLGRFLRNCGGCQQDGGNQKHGDSMDGLHFGEVMSVVLI